ncbi:MAG TPA: SUMF1/EgtB/PvdO family nonheme iron enzyme [Balneolaceae bacterium]|nr:SUMF1/EgtB/PvdO family nonheme iron enzyme [Balneolaceae bacterium]
MSFVLLLFCISTTIAQQPQYQGDLNELFAGPKNTSSSEVWLNEMKSWRKAEKDSIHFNAKTYLQPQLGWLKKSFIYVQMMAHDRYFYDPIHHQYTVDRFLNDLKKRYGGIDAVLIWPTYPNIGIDNRNQYDLVQDMPGGVEGIKKMIRQFKNRGVRVFFPIMIWDRGTRRISESMPVALVKEMKMLGADGMNGDTMWGVTKDFQQASDSLSYPLVYQPELGMPELNKVKWNTSSWGYYWDYKFEPGVSVYKWLEPRHQVFVTNRWAVNKTNDLQYAFFNGVGYNAWENIWGVWNQIPKRYEEAIRRISTIYHEFPAIWNSEDWRPFIPTLKKGIFASEFPGTDETVYTVVNRDSVDKSGEQLELPYKENVKYFDIWHGTELSPKKEGDHIVLIFPVDSNSFGAILAIKSYKMDLSYVRFIQKMHVLSEKSLSSYSTDWHPLQQHITLINKTSLAESKPDGMVLISGAKNYEFETKGTMIEGDPLPKEVGVQYPWNEHPSRSHKHTMDIPSFYMDKYPVTNKEYKQFLDATHYHPVDDHNFLKDWKNGTYPKGWDNKPVTWVSLKDARAYAKWAGKRLPHEWEWQYAAQGTTGNQYPWGNKMDSTKIPPPDTSRTMRPPTDVDAYPQGASPFGVVDMVGNVWQWTDEYADEHTRSAILKGGGYYRSASSHWYFPKAYEVQKYGKYLLMAPSLDRSGAVGFRCVKDK